MHRVPSSAVHDPQARELCKGDGGILCEPACHHPSILHIHLKRFAYVPLIVPGQAVGQRANIYLLYSHTHLGARSCHLKRDNTPKGGEKKKSIESYSVISKAKCHVHLICYILIYFANTFTCNCQVIDRRDRQTDRHGQLRDHPPPPIHIDYPHPQQRPNPTTATLSSNLVPSASLSRPQPRYFLIFVARLWFDLRGSFAVALEYILSIDTYHCIYDSFCFLHCRLCGAFSPSISTSRGAWAPY